MDRYDQMVDRLAHNAHNAYNVLRYLPLTDLYPIIN
jgi:hypothetical protein